MPSSPTVLVLRTAVVAAFRLDKSISTRHSPELGIVPTMPRSA
jgi:hypothetical protein